MTTDELVNVLQPHLTGYDSMMAFHELLPTALHEHADELSVTVCLEISERARTILEAKSTTSNLDSKWVLRAFAKDNRAKAQETVDRAIDQLDAFLRHRAPGFHAWMKVATPPQLSARLVDVTPPSLF